MILKFQYIYLMFPTVAEATTPTANQLAVVHLHTNVRNFSGADVTGNSKNINFIRLPFFE